MQRTPVNPWQWSLAMGFHQAEVVTGHARVLFCSGQSAVDGDGNPRHLGDMPAQVALAVDNFEAVLREAEMTLANVVRLNIYTTDVDSFLANYGVLASRTGAARVTPPATLLGVTRLAFPELMVELEATATA